LFESDFTLASGILDGIRNGLARLEVFHGTAIADCRWFVDRRQERCRWVENSNPVIPVTHPGRFDWHKRETRLRITMRTLFILTALIFALVTAATATVVATTLYSKAPITYVG